MTAIEERNPNIVFMVNIDAVIMAFVDDIWSSYDVDGNGSLDKDETK